MYNHKDGAPFETAKKMCKKEPPGATLAMPKRKNHLTSFWIGLYDPNKDRYWTWLDDSPLEDYTSLTPSYNNDSELFQTNPLLYAGCVVISHEDKTTVRAIPCTLKTGVLCQVDALDIPWPDKNSHDTSCYCSRHSSCKCCEDEKVLTNITSTTIEVIVEDLKLDKSTLSSYLRAKTSAPDSRVSSRFLGSIGIMLITLIFGFIVALDFTPPRRFKVKFLRKVHRKLAYRLSNRRCQLRETVHVHYTSEN
ncbi:uncharacterized protein LOC127720918 [Mytilus californianus]|uniref:uncharacterized protein LOC127720918 n=1 Tax=Mytilus californianus TaxID=6549 RepID=UPI0022452E1B|nr:uncharacterized protein LOC127720918 [Mytilus californianus]